LLDLIKNKRRRRKMKKAIFWAVLAVCFVLSMTMAHAEEHMGANPEVAMEEPVVADAPAAVNVGNKICPISGDAIVEETKVTVEYEGKIYNLCCPACVDTFNADPMAGIAKVEAELAAPVAEEAPMVEEVPAAE
jgi:YHS domain-containing protein